ncbi:NAD-dependent succinate-semialdehyde dehydrogenase [Streptomyces sp. NPDC057199]|uniref:NAD-dependent succinate-semialdehyde dehydrogenase n=1 Tax=Streptomyces sp. NPDC057199 TaxID=3346047 RepID=UPI00363858B1
MTLGVTPRALSKLPDGLLVGGTWRPASSGRTFEVLDPASGEVLASVADAGPQDGAAALGAVAAAQSAWAATPSRQRAELLRRAFERLTADRETVAELISAEMGKPFAEALAEVDYGAEFLRWYSEEAPRITGDHRRSPDGGSRLLVHHRPVGPCLLITPWNFPLAMATRKVGAALAAGCTAILKPAAQTPLTSLLLARILQECGLPDGVLAVLTTKSAGAVCGPLLADGRIRKLSFTGSTEVGRRLLEQCGPQIVRPSMELGGNAPFIVLADADLDRAVEGAMVAKMRNMGEACTAANRFLVHQDVADEFSEKLAARIADLRMGHGLDTATQVGPVIDEDAQVRLGGLVADAVGRGARLAEPGGVVDGPGTFFKPTVVVDVPTEARLFTEEIFGPVVAITAVADTDEAVELANRTEYGLVAYLYTRDVEKALNTVDRLEVGMVALNRGIVSNAAAPFGGVKQSGLGREGGREGIHDYLDIQYVALDA